MTRHPSRTPLLSVLSLAIAVAVAGCGSSNDDSPSDLQNDPSRPGTTTPPGNTTPPSDTTPPGDTAPPGDTTPPDQTTPPEEMPSGGETGSQTPVPGDDDALPTQVSNALAAAFSVARGDALETLYALGDRLVERTDDGTFALTSAPPTEGFPQSATYACPLGGSVTVDRSAIPGTSTTALSMTACAVGPLVVTGGLSNRINGGSIVFPNRSLWGVVIDAGYTLTDSRDGSTTRMSSGTASLPVADTGGEVTFGRDGLELGAQNLSVSGGQGGSYSATSLDLSEFDRATTADGEMAGLTMTIDGLNGGDVTEAGVVTTTPFRRETRDENFRTGMARLTGSAGLVYDLDADDGDPATFTLTVQEDGSTTAYTVPWSMAFNLDGFDPGSVDLGF